MAIMRYVIFDHSDPEAWKPQGWQASLGEIDAQAASQPITYLDDFIRVDVRLEFTTSGEICDRIENFSEFVGSIVDGERLRNDFSKLRAEHKALLKRLRDAPRPRYKQVKYRLITLLSRAGETADEKQARLDGEALLKGDAEIALRSAHVAKEVAVPIDDSSLICFLYFQKSTFYYILRELADDGELE